MLPLCLSTIPKTVERPKPSPLPSVLVAKKLKNVRQAFLGNAAARVADSDFHDVQLGVESAGKDKGPSVRHGVNSVE